MPGFSGMPAGDVMAKSGTATQLRNLDRRVARGKKASVLVAACRSLYESLLDKINQFLDVLQDDNRKLEEHGSRLDGHDARIGALDDRVIALEQPRMRSR
jgi:inhibitor of KinA sporulation pathway (predicted exonuclease)